MIRNEFFLFLISAVSLVTAKQSRLQNYELAMESFESYSSALLLYSETFSIYRDEIYTLAISKGYQIGI